MRRSRFTQEQIVGVLQEHEAGAATASLCRQHGIREQTLYRWKQKYGGLERGEATRRNALEDDHRRLKRLGASASPRQPDPERSPPKTRVMPAERRAAAQQVQERYGRLAAASVPAAGDRAFTCALSSKGSCRRSCLAAATPRRLGLLLATRMICTRQT